MGKDELVLSYCNVDPSLSFRDRTKVHLQQ